MKKDNNKRNIRYLIIGYIIIVLTIIGCVAAQSRTGGEAPTFGLRSDDYSPQQVSGTVAVTFQDVAGIDEVEEDLREITDFAKFRDKYEALGAKIPKGVILAGPPGTGKTLIAKAIAGETDRAFYTISGSEFVEVYVGVGASRVRKVFESARKNSPSIIFIDEIDAIGAKRDGKRDDSERIQTLNQLLAEMDGFNDSSDVIVIAATNRLESLDPALTRSGRFDRHVFVPLPDRKAREAILRLHARNYYLDAGADLSRLAKTTSGASGADLANMLNEAAILAGRNNAPAVAEEHLEEARYRVIFGSQARKIELSALEKRATAFHEAGHTIVSHLVPHATPAERVTIIPRGPSLGHTEFSPEENRYSIWKNQLIDQLAVLMGGRAAEEIFLGDVSSGAQNDLERATELARNMVMKWGMNDQLGLTSSDRFSEETARAVDREVRLLLDTAYQRASMTLKKHSSQVRLMAEQLLEHETLKSEEIRAIVHQAD